MDGLAAMADRRAAPARNPGGNAEKYGLKRLEIATGPVKTAIFSGNNARLYDIDSKKAELQLRNDQFVHTSEAILRYGYTNNPT